MSSQSEADEKRWYAMRAYKSENTAEERLSAIYGLKHFIPKQKVLRTHNGKKIPTLEPVIRSLVFVYATQRQIVDFKRRYYNDLQFVMTKTSGNLSYLTIPAKQMDDFIAVCQQREQEVHFYQPDEINNGAGLLNIAKGQKVRVHGGPLDKVEGYFVKVAKKRGRKFVVILLDLLVVSTEVSPDYLEVIE